MSAPASQQVETLWTKNEVAAFLGKSASWVSHNRHLLPPPCRIGGELRWPPAEIRAWAEAQREPRTLPVRMGPGK